MATSFAFLTILFRYFVISGGIKPLQPERKLEKTVKVTPKKRRKMTPKS